MIPEKMLQVLEDEGVVALATQGALFHLVNSWNSYIEITEEGSLLIPAGRMHQTEANLKENDRVLLTLGSRQVDGFRSKGTGFLIEGRGEFKYEGKDYALMKARFPWLRAVLVISPQSITQTL